MIHTTYFMFESVFFDVPTTEVFILDTPCLVQNGRLKSFKLMYSCRKPPQT